MFSLLKYWWLIIRLKISHRCNFLNKNTFDLLIELVANKFIKEMESLNNASKLLNSLKMGEKFDFLIRKTFNLLTPHSVIYV
jgi:hypothetical protein